MEEKELVEMVKSNFGKGDYFFTFSYPEKDKERKLEATIRDVERFIERQEEWLENNEKNNLKCIATIKESPKKHIHVFTNFPDRDLLERLWDKKGRAMTGRILTDEQLEEVTRYMHRKGHKKILLSPGIEPNDSKQN